MEARRGKLSAPEEGYLNSGGRSFPTINNIAPNGGQVTRAGNSLDRDIGPQCRAKGLARLGLEPMEMVTGEFQPGGQPYRTMQPGGHVSASDS
jgi:hypothetical protein